MGVALTLALVSLGPIFPSVWGSWPCWAGMKLSFGPSSASGYPRGYSHPRLILGTLSRDFPQEFLIPLLGDQMTAPFSGSLRPALMARVIGGPFLLPLHQQWHREYRSCGHNILYFTFLLNGFYYFERIKMDMVETGQKKSISNNS